MMGAIHDISLYIHYHAHYFARESGRYCIPFPRAGCYFLTGLPFEVCRWYHAPELREITEMQ